MQHQRGELNAPTWLSKIVSRFKGSKPRDERIWDEIDDLWNALANIAGKVNAIMAKFDAIETELADLQANQSAMAGKVAAAAAAFNNLRVAVADLKRQLEELGNDDAKIAELAAAFDAIDKAGDETAAALDSATNNGPTSSTGGV